MGPGNRGCFLGRRATDHSGIQDPFFMDSESASEYHAALTTTSELCRKESEFVAPVICAVSLASASFFDLSLGDLRRNIW